MMSLSNASPVSRLYHSYYLKKQQQQQKGRGSGGQFGQIYQGQRFPSQDGSGIGSFLGSIARGVANLIDRTPQWLKSGAKIVGKSALQGLSDYAGDVQAGVPADMARKRAFRSTLGNVLERGGKRLKTQAGGKRKRRRRRTTQRKKKKQSGGAACCKLKKLKRQRQRRRGGRKQIGGKKKQKKIKRRSSKSAAAASKRQRRGRRAIKRRTKFDLFSV